VLFSGMLSNAGAGGAALRWWMESRRLFTASDMVVSTGSPIGHATRNRAYFVQQDEHLSSIQQSASPAFFIP
jgi:hypothetical protein